MRRYINRIGMRTTFLGLLVVFTLYSCSKDEDVLGNVPGNISKPNSGKIDKSGDWLIPINEVFDGGAGKDGIPALSTPERGPFTSGNYLKDSDLVLGYYDGNSAMAYPHQILDWHEIINDRLNTLPFAITYCPLTGTGIGWKRIFNSKLTTFGVSGLIYDNNLIPYDRETGSNWSQMRLECVNGALINTEIKTFTLLETNWKTWKEMYPSTQVVTLNTGYDRSYGTYPYGDYKTNENFLLFPLGIVDKRLNKKERVHGIIIEGVAKVYRFGSFNGSNSVIKDVVNGEEVIVIGNVSKNYIVSFYSQLNDGTTPVYTAVNKNNIILEDNLGNEWDVFGYAVSGPSKGGKRLRSTESFMGYWFSWGAFYPELEIYND